MATETTREKIDRLKLLLQSGVTSSAIDGESVTFDLSAVRRELAQLEASDGTRRKRSRVMTPYMGRR